LPLATQAHERLRFVPQDFHTCGKYCGKTGLVGVLGAENVIIHHLLRAKVENEPVFGLLMRGVPQSNSKIKPLSGRKSCFSSGFMRS
jgi:hypothetical protein